MTLSTSEPTIKQTHPWLRAMSIAWVPGKDVTPLAAQSAEKLLGHFEALGHSSVDTPDEDTDIILTTAPYGQDLGWREALLFMSRRRFGIKGKAPTIYTMVHLTNQEFDDAIAHYDQALAKDPLDPEDYTFPGLSEASYNVLVEQGERGGAILSLQRQMQAQAKSVRILLLVGDDAPERIYHFDLVGAYPTSEYAWGEEAFYNDAVLRIVTTESTEEVTKYEVVGDALPRSEWDQMTTPEAMAVAGREVGQRNFFTNMIRVNELVNVPAVNDAIASQYSEGCFSTWEPLIGGLVATVTGSARPVDKGAITENDLAVIVGVKPDGFGAQVRQVENKQNDPPSSEAVEMYDMDTLLPRIKLGNGWDVQAEVPVVRSKLHGHRGVESFDPTKVEFVPLEPPYYHYLVSCATGAQAEGIKGAFSRAECLLNPDDPRQVAFTVLPGHGVMIVEKWQAGKVPFQTIWEYMDEGALVIDKHVPQGVMTFKQDADGLMHLHED
ncbi:MAG: tetratricopeptide repeat protein [Chloroflexi bacterium]|nr:MAG: tetratricopeptide repeat protein [Chloroflexota bacterium]MBL1194591.1 tetratricopeptide repeat protein [Chloroflexota bacterium]NOH11880.1 hypothetical protein [Chloroflexota bacterium]